MSQISICAQPVPARGQPCSGGFRGRGGSRAASPQSSSRTVTVLGRGDGHCQILPLPLTSSAASRREASSGGAGLAPVPQCGGAGARQTPSLLRETLRNVNRREGEKSSKRSERNYSHPHSLFPDCCLRYSVFLTGEKKINNHPQKILV